MPADDNTESRSCGIQVEGKHIVQDIQADFTRFCNRRFWKRSGPIGSIYVSAYCGHGSEVSQSGEDFGFAYVPGMENQFRAAQCLHSLWPQQAVGVRDQANVRRRS